MPNYRRDRVNEEVQKELSEILRDIKDPRVSKSFVSITGVEVTPDLKYAKVFYSFLGGVSDSDVQKGLESAHGYIRGQIAQRLNLRQTPEFKFIRDTSIEHGAHISSLFKEVENERKEQNKDE